MFKHYCCCFCYSYQQRTTTTTTTNVRFSSFDRTASSSSATVNDEVMASTLDRVDQKDFKFVKNKVKKLLPKDSTSYEQICSIARKCISPTNMGFYFTHLVSGTAANGGIKTAEDLEATFNSTWEKGMQQRQQQQQQQQEQATEELETAEKFTVKLVLLDSQKVLPLFSESPFAKMVQLEFGPLYAAMVINDVVLEWDDTGLIIPSTAGKDWVFQTSLDNKFDKFSRSTELEIGDYSPATMDLLQKQTEQLFEIAKQKQEAIDELIDLIIHYNEHYEYNVLSRNSQHFVLDAMKVLGVEEIPSLTAGAAAFQSYLEELRHRKRADMLEKFESHEALDQHVSEVLSPDLSQHDMEYLLCQYFMLHVTSCCKHTNKKETEWKCEEETCRMKDIEQMLKQESLILKSHF